MSALTIKNIPVSLHQALKRSAEDHRRSLNGEVIFCLEKALHSPSVSAEAILARARALRRRMPKLHLTDKDLNEAKRFGRA